MRGPEFRLGLIRKLFVITGGVFGDQDRLGVLSFSLAVRGWRRVSQKGKCYRFGVYPVASLCRKLGRGILGSGSVHDRSLNASDWSLKNAVHRQAGCVWQVIVLLGPDGPVVTRGPFEPPNAHAPIIRLVSLSL